MCFSAPRPQMPAEKAKAKSPDQDVATTRARVRGMTSAGFGSTNVTGGQGVTGAGGVVKKRLLGT